MIKFQIILLSAEGKIFHRNNLPRILCNSAECSSLILDARSHFFRCARRIIWLYRRDNVTQKHGNARYQKSLSGGEINRYHALVLYSSVFCCDINYRMLLFVCRRCHDIKSDMCLHIFRDFTFFFRRYKMKIKCI